MSLLEQHDKKLKEREAKLIEEINKLGPTPQLRKVKDLILVRYARRRDQLVLDRNDELGGKAMELRDLLSKVFNFPE